MAWHWTRADQGPGSRSRPVARSLGSSESSLPDAQLPGSVVGAVSLRVQEVMGKLGCASTAFCLLYSADQVPFTWMGEEQ
jgi:hypothetical protein